MKISTSSFFGAKGVDDLTLPETNGSPLKIDGWNTILSYWGGGLFFRGELAVSFREGNSTPGYKRFIWPHAFSQYRFRSVEPRMAEKNGMDTKANWNDINVS